MNHLQTYAIFEGITDVVYHFTSVYGIVGISEQDRFRLTFATGDDLKGTPKPFFMSVSRTGTSLQGYARHAYNRMPVCLELDGRKIGQRYKVTKVDFWGQDLKHNSFEFEDRILNNLPYIPKASTYIDAIHVLVLTADRYNHDTKTTSNEVKIYIDDYHKMQEYAKRSNIKLLFYKNKNDWDSKRNGLPETDTTHMWKGGPEPISEYDLQDGNHMMLKIIPAFVVYEEEKLPMIAKLAGIELTEEIIEKIKYNTYNFERYSHEPNLLEGDIHSLKSSLFNIRKTSHCLDFLNYISQEFRKYGVNDIGPYIIAKLAKLAPPA